LQNFANTNCIDTEAEIAQKREKQEGMIESSVTTLRYPLFGVLEFFWYYYLKNCWIFLKVSIKKLYGVIKKLYIPNLLSFGLGDPEVHSKTK